MKTTVTIVRVTDGDTDDVWVDVTCEDDSDVDVVEVLGVIEMGKHLLLEQG